jgi:6-pyruvoyltetrahydropterin/6-carboxytetrahydropterin synthase
MPRVQVSRKLHFSAAHMLARRDWSPERNLEVFGPCANPNGHGHNYDLEVTVSGEIEPETGFVLDLKRLSALVEQHVVRDLDHKNINVEVAWMREINPTTENLVVAIWRRLEPVLPAGIRLERIVLWETARNHVEYTGE